MSESTSRLLLVLGTGPGIGDNVASLFASKRFDKVFLVARNSERLASSKKAVLDAAKAANRHVEVKTHSANLSNTNDVKKILTEVDAFGKDALECVFFNAARVRQAGFFDDTEEEILYDFKVCLP